MAILSKPRLTRMVNSVIGSRSARSSRRLLLYLPETRLQFKFLRPTQSRSRRCPMICGKCLPRLQPPKPPGKTRRLSRAWTGSTGLSLQSRPRPEKAGLIMPARCLRRARSGSAASTNRAITARVSAPPRPKISRMAPHAFIKPMSHFSYERLTPCL